MRALHVLKTSTGASWALRQIRELVRLGVEVHVALPPGGLLVPRYREVGAVVHPVQLDLPARAPWRVGRVLAAARRLVSEVSPDVVHSHFVGTTLTLRLALGKGSPLPRVFQVPGPLHLEHPAYRGAELATAGPADHWIGSCEWTCARYRRSGVPRERVFLSYYGTDVDGFSARRSGALRRELGVGDGTPLVGLVAYLYAPKYYLGQTRGLKGHEDLIDAVALLRERRPELRCVVVGAAWGGAARYEERVRAYARRRCGDRVVFLGFRADVADLYPDLDVAVHPSLSENVGGAVESLLSGVPTIATEVGGFPDVVRPGETGWLVPPRSPEALALAIDEALGDPRQARALAATGRRLVGELFDVRRTAAEVAGIYETIAGAGRVTGDR
ncbi:MAG: glycosyltransferase family 4 protein [Deferrisomatales bacterium]